jgi:hypothetical protein
MEVANGSVQEGASGILSSKVSHASYGGSIRDKSRMERRESAGRSSLNSITSSSQEESDDNPEDLARLRRALEITQKELQRTEVELTDALIALAREREENRKHKNHKHSFSRDYIQKDVNRGDHWHLYDIKELVADSTANCSCDIDASNFDSDKPYLTDQTKYGAKCELIFNFIKS